jgi:hypothetical protein
LGNATVTKKSRSILNKFFAFIAVLCFTFQVIGQSNDQDPKRKTWKNEKDYLKYKKQKNYEGPDDWYGGSPSTLEEEDEDLYSGSGSNNKGTQGIQYNPQRIQKDRQKQYGPYQGGGGNGSLDLDPKVKEPDPVKLPEIESPDLPDVDLPDVDGPTIPASFWKVVLFLIIAIAIIFAIYALLKNRTPVNRAVAQDVENDWNPEVITKTELELRLEEALDREDFREGIRIYFTFILKELIRKNWIHWKKDKTNHHYLMEMAARPKVDLFRECVRIYDLVWYGEYEIDRMVFESLQPTLLNYYQMLSTTND